MQATNLNVEFLHFELLRLYIRTVLKDRKNTHWKQFIKKNIICLF